MAGMANAVSNVNVNEQAGSTSTFHSSAVGGGGGLGIDLGFFSIGGSASGSSYDSKATNAFAQQPLPARRLVEPEHGDLDARRELDDHRRGQHANPLRGGFRGSVRVVVAHVREPEPLPRAHVPLLQAQQVPDPEVGADRDRPDRARPERPHRRPAEQPAAVERRHRDPGRDPRHERQAAERPAERDGVARVRAVEPAPVQRRPLHRSGRERGGDRGGARRRPEGRRRGARQGRAADEGRRRSLRRRRSSSTGSARSPCRPRGSSSRAASTSATRASPRSSARSSSTCSASTSRTSC